MRTTISFPARHPFGWDWETAVVYAERGDLLGYWNIRWKDRFRG